MLITGPNSEFLAGRRVRYCQRTPTAKWAEVCQGERVQGGETKEEKEGWEGGRLQRV